jgi:integrase
MLRACGLSRIERRRASTGPTRLSVRRGKARKPRPVSLPTSALPSLQDWLQVRGNEPGPLFCAVLKNGRLVREPDGRLQGLSGSAAWSICKGRGRKAGIQPPAPHDLRRPSWYGQQISCRDGIGNPGHPA